jgi:hypothetical protein
VPLVEDAASFLVFATAAAPVVSTAPEPIVPAAPVAPVTSDGVPETVEAPIVPVSELPTVAVVCSWRTGAGEPTFAGADDAVSVEKNW